MLYEVITNHEFWSRIDDIPNHSYWSMHQSLKSELLEEAGRRAHRQLRRNGASQAQVDRLTRYLDPEKTGILTIGFARRFATYKRATLIFSDPKRLERLVNDPERPSYNFV